MDGRNNIIHKNFTIEFKRSAFAKGHYKISSALLHTFHERIVLALTTVTIGRRQHWHLK